MALTLLVQFFVGSPIALVEFWDVLCLEDVKHDHTVFLTSELVAFGHLLILPLYTGV